MIAIGVGVVAAIGVAVLGFGSLDTTESYTDAGGLVWCNKQGKMVHPSQCPCKNAS
jgi:hypothetical protein